MNLKKEKQATAILENYYQYLKNKGLKLPKVKDNRKLASLTIGWLENEYQSVDEELNQNQKSSNYNVDEFDPRWQAATYILRLETKEEEDLTEYKWLYKAFDNNDKEITAQKSIYKLHKALNEHFNKHPNVSKYSLEFALKTGQLEFNWGRIEKVENN